MNEVGSSGGFMANVERRQLKIIKGTKGATKSEVQLDLY